MTVKIIPSAEFDRQFKRLAKKYKSLLDDYLTFSPSRWDRYLGMTAAMTQYLSPRLALQRYEKTARNA